MDSTLDTKIKAIKEQFRAGNPDTLTQASKLVKEYPDEVRVWMLRAHIHGMNRSYNNAIADYTRAIDLCPTEPALFFHRGIEYSTIGDYQRTIDDCSRGLAACDLHSNDYYREALHFHRADAYLKLGNKEAALEDLKNVEDDFSWWINDFCSKQELLAQCR